MIDHHFAEVLDRISAVDLICYFITLTLHAYSHNDRDRFEYMISHSFHHLMEELYPGVAKIYRTVPDLVETTKTLAVPWMKMRLAELVMTVRSIIREEFGPKPSEQFIYESLLDESDKFTKLRLYVKERLKYGPFQTWSSLSKEERDLMDTEFKKNPTRNH